MDEQADWSCPVHPDSCADQLVRYNARFDEYGLPIRDGQDGAASSAVSVSFCPWCGTRLPESRRDAWFDHLNALGIDPATDALPEAFTTSDWWRIQPTD